MWKHNVNEEQGGGFNVKGENANIYRIRSNNTKSGANKMVVTLDEHNRSPKLPDGSKETTESRGD